FLSMFDDADILRCYRRSESVVPQQALAMANSTLAMSMAREITNRLESERSDLTDTDFVLSAFRLVVGRGPDEEETALCLEAMSQIRGVLGDADPSAAQLRARQNLVHAFINHNDFVTIR
ncbi:MAG: DUF1553 domain-containing protein, partial [Planctomycetaceae bacterium]|nr:DUF1553 domain-containing protein [Planctomycetaceae bacterium]